MDDSYSEFLFRQDRPEDLQVPTKMTKDGYSFIQGVSSKTEKDIETSRRREKPPEITRGFRIWRNPNSQLSNALRQYMDYGVTPLLFYLGLDKANDFREPRMVECCGTDEPQTFVLGTPSEKENQLKFLFRPLQFKLSSDHGFFQIHAGSCYWGAKEVYDWFRMPTKLKWDGIEVDHSQVLIIEAGTLIRFASKEPCTFVCMGYSREQPDYTPEDMQLEDHGAPFFEIMPTEQRHAVLARLKR